MLTTLQPLGNALGNGRRRLPVLAVLVALAVLLGLAAASSGQAAPRKPGNAFPIKAFPIKDFPIAVWLQDPQNAGRYRQAGINLYVGLWQGPTEAQLNALKSAHMPVICAQNAVGLAHKTDPTIAGWMQQDEPDDAQLVTNPATGKADYGPCVPPSKVVAEYARLHAADPTRPILLNLSQGVANEAWVGRGVGSSLDQYHTFVQGGDIVSFDVYPVAGGYGVNDLWYVPKGVDRLAGWTGGRKPVWACIECTHIGDANAQATPAQVRAEVWMALIHGARGLIYFVHQFKPQFDEHALLDDLPMLTAVSGINQQIHALSPALNSPTVSRIADVCSSSPQCPIDLLTKRQGRATYVFAVAMRNAAGRGTFTMRGLPPTATAEVLGEGRALTIRHGRFADDFAPYAVHLYRIH